jgi:hypothetical protein
LDSEVDEDINGVFFQANIKLSSSLVEPGNNVDITVDTKCNSYVGLLGVDQNALTNKMPFSLGVPFPGQDFYNSEWTQSGFGMRFFIHILFKISKNLLKKSTILIFSLFENFQNICSIKIVLLVIRWGVYFFRQPL